MLNPSTADAQRGTGSEESLLASAAKTFEDIGSRSFPEIDASRIRIRAFSSESTFFKARFSICRYITFRNPRFLVYINRDLANRELPEKALEGIVAHELAHLSYYSRKNRFQLLGLAGLISREFTARFERGADLEAIIRGYGPGLISYREWLYKNVPGRLLARKKRDYFTPEEIRLISEALKSSPDLKAELRKNVPKNIDELRAVLRKRERKTDSRT